MKKYGWYFTVILLMSCTDKSPESVLLDDIPFLELEEVFSVEETEDFFVSMPVEIQLDHEGFIYMIDAGPQQIIVFNPDGSVEAKIGRSGSGPGEFTQINNLNIGIDGKLYVYDGRARTMSVFSNRQDGFQFLTSSTIPLPTARFPLMARANDRGEILLQYTTFQLPGEESTEVNDSVYLFPVGAESPGEPLLEVRRMEMVLIDVNGNMANLMRPYGGTTHIKPGPNGTFYVTWSLESMIYQYDNNGNRIDSLGVDMPRLPVTEEDRANYRGSSSPIAQGLASHLPDMKAITNEFFVSINGEIWQWYGNRGDGTWILYNSEGVPVHRVIAPEGFRLTQATDQIVYGVNFSEAQVKGFRFR